MLIYWNFWFALSLSKGSTLANDSWLPEENVNSLLAEAYPTVNFQTVYMWISPVIFTLCILNVFGTYRLRVLIFCMDSLIKMSFISNNASGLKSLPDNTLISVFIWLLFA